MPLKDVDYKILSFTREDAVFVSLKVIMVDPFNLNENFQVLTKDNMNTVKEIELFNWINQQRYTINEFNFFALNNNLCLKVLDKENNVLNSFGVCGTADTNRYFALEFGLNFN